MRDVYAILLGWHYQETLFSDLGGQARSVPQGTDPSG
jgi:hypothetical protein